jgi:hypothetical protein
MYLFWMTTSDHEEDCFVVSDSRKKAIEYFASEEEFELNEIRAKLVEKLPPKGTPLEGYAGPGLLTSLGFKIVSEDRPTIYARRGSTYVYGCLAYRLFMSNLVNGPGVYCLRCAGSDFIKIGETTDVHSRLRTLQTGCPYRLILDFFIPTEITRPVERKLHRELAQFKTQFEWFDVPEPQRTVFYLFARHLAIAELGSTFREYVVSSP